MQWWEKRLENEQKAAVIGTPEGLCEALGSGWEPSSKPYWASGRGYTVSRSGVNKIQAWVSIFVPEGQRSPVALIGLGFKREAGPGGQIYVYEHVFDVMCSNFQVDDPYVVAVELLRIARDRLANILEFADSLHGEVYSRDLLSSK